MTERLVLTICNSKGERIWVADIDDAYFSVTKRVVDGKPNFVITFGEQSGLPLEGLTPDD